MNDSRNNPKSFPPDDFSATTPNIKIPKQDLPDYQNEGTNDWEKTNYNYSPKDLQADQWSKPAYNQPPQNQPSDYNQNYGQPPRSAQKDSEWGMTQANINIPRNQPSDSTQNRQGNFGGQRREEFGATAPFVQLPDDERQKYQNLPPAAPAAKPEGEEKKGGIPGWLWAVGGLLGVFLFAVVVIVGIYLVSVTPGYDVIVKNAPPGTKFRVNNSSPVQVTENGNYRLQALRANETKSIVVEAPKGWSCKNFEIPVERAVDGAELPVDASCQEQIVAAVSTPKAGCDPKTFTKGDIKKSHDCAYEKLNALKDPFTVEELLEAMRLYIINFASGKYNINADDMKFLEKSAEYVKKLPPDIKIEVSGHTDNTGRDNQKLSENRANAVRNALISFGVKEDRLSMQGYADRKPIDSNDTDDGKFRNRRIDYRVE